jgi:hypothetical protein
MRLDTYTMGFVLSSGLVSYAIDRRMPLKGARLAGISEITESLQSISDLLKGIQSFISSLSNISIISNVIGLETLLLLAAIIVFSMGLSALGVPKGKLAFLISLCTADFLWILWKVSMKAALPGYLPQILKSNMVVLLPFLAVTVIARLVPLLWGKIKRRVFPLFRKRHGLDKQKLLMVYDEYLAQNAVLQRLVAAEVLGSKDGEKIGLSDETINAIEDLKATLLKFNAK